MDLPCIGDQPSATGTVACCTRAVRIDAPFTGRGGLSAVTVTFDPGEKHWHGTPPDAAMTLVAVAETKEGKAVDWMEQVSDVEHGASTLTAG